ncbi:MAG: DUF2442 domain-containing protein [Candidatus Riflebacteria bacterium]
MFYRVKSVEPMPEFILFVTFENDIVKQYNVKPLIKKFEPFQIFLTTPTLFNCVRVDQGGYGIVWNDELDISCNELWNNGRPCRQKAA